MLLGRDWLTIKSEFGKLGVKFIRKLLVEDVWLCLMIRTQVSSEVYQSKNGIKTTRQDTDNNILGRVDHNVRKGNEEPQVRTCRSY